MAEAVIQINRETKGWYLRGYLGNQGWTEEGPFKTLKQAHKATNEYAALCGFGRFIVTVEE